MATPNTQFGRDRLMELLTSRAEAALRTPATSDELVAPGLAVIPRRLDPLTPAPLSAAQARLWFVSQYQPDSAAYNVPVVLRLRGSVDTVALQAAVRDVANRHYVLRSVVRAGEAEPVSVVLDSDAVPVSVRATTPAELDEDLRDAAGAPFRLDRDTPMRAVLLMLPDDELVLAMTFHHIAFDDWSYDIVVRDLAACYAARLGRAAAPPTAPLQFADVVDWERSRPVDAASLAWWAQRLNGLSPALDLPTDRPRAPVADWTAGEVPVTIPTALADRVRATAQAANATPYMVLMAAWQLLLGRLTASDDIGVAVPEAGRPEPETEGVVGCFVNTVVARTDFSDDPSGRELVGRVRDVVLEALAHADAPFDQVVARIHPERSQAFAPVVQVLLNVLDQPKPELRIAGLEVTAQDTPFLTTQFDLSLNLLLGDGYRGVLVYRTDLFDRGTAQNWAHWYLAALDGLVSGLDEPVSSVEPLSDTELRRLVAVGTGPSLPDHPVTVVDAILQHASRAPETCATSDPDGRLSYAELVDWSADAAAAISARMSVTDGVIGVCLPRDRFLPAALFGVLLAGAGYLPLEPDHPPARIAQLVDDAGIRLVVTRGAARTAAFSIPGVTVIDLDRPPHGRVATLPTPVAATDLAYLLYTSGSTGQPKGVEVTHGNLAALVAGLRTRPGLRVGDVVLALAPLAFDASVGEIWATLAGGATCHVVERDSARDGVLLAERIAAAGVTIMNVPPTTLRMLRAAGWTGHPGLRVWSGGEPLDSTLAREITGTVAELWNVYGPTEATNISATHPVTDLVKDRIPVGTAAAGERLYVMDRRGRLALPGVTGELWIGGAGVARGYHNRPDLTAAAFRADPIVPGERCYRTGDLVRWDRHGELEFIGRSDRQVKLRGNRVEPDEIESALLRQPSVAACAVAMRGTGPDAHLVGYLVPAGIRPTEVEAALRRELPEYCVPRRWVTLDCLPVLPSGKVDQGRLPAPGPHSDEPRHPPRSDAELLVADVWRTVLGHDEISAADDFFALGGHSLAAARVTGRLTEALSCRVPVRLLFDRPRLAQFAAAIEELVLADIAADEGR